MFLYGRKPLKIGKNRKADWFQDTASEIFEQIIHKVLRRLYSFYDYRTVHTIPRGIYLKIGVLKPSIIVWNENQI